MNPTKYILTVLLFFPLISFAGGKGKLVSGPIQGHTTATSMKIWIMVKGAEWATITIKDTSNTYENNLTLFTNTLAIYQDFTPLTFDFDDLPTNHVYTVSIKVDGKKYSVDRLYRTSKTDVNDSYQFLVESCALSVPVGLRWLHPGIEDRIYRRASKTTADFNLWLGDYLYYFPKDYKTEEGMTKVWIEKRQRKLIAKFTATMPQYSIWDDHDFGWNDSDSSFIHREHSLELFKRFWANPAYGTANYPGCFYKFDYLDSEFFMLDDRYYRNLPTDSIPEKESKFHVFPIPPTAAPNKTSPTMLGEGQLAWLKQGLKESKAVFKFVAIGVQIFNQNSSHEVYWHYQAELQDLVAFIKKEKIEGVVFLSGDRHYSELTKTEFDGLYPIYELTSSGITSFRYKASKKPESVNPTRIEGTLADFQNYGRITISGEQGNRLCNIEILNNRGKLLWEYQINENDLKLGSAVKPEPVKIE